MYEYAAILKYERNQYAKDIRKKYETGILKEKRKNMRQIVPRTDDISNTISTVVKDNMLIVKEVN